MSCTVRDGMQGEMRGKSRRDEGRDGGRAKKMHKGRFLQKNHTHGNQFCQQEKNEKGTLDISKSHCAASAPARYALCGKKSCEPWYLKRIQGNKRQPAKAQKQMADIAVLLAKIYEDTVFGGLSRKRCQKIAENCGAERDRLKLGIEVIEMPDRAAVCKRRKWVMSTVFERVTKL